MRKGGHEIWEAKKYYIAITESERRIIINALNILLTNGKLTRTLPT